MGYREELQTAASNIQQFISDVGVTASLEQIQLLSSILQALELTKPAQTSTGSVGATDVRDGVNASAQIQEINTNTASIDNNLETLYTLLNSRGLATETTLTAILTQLQGDRAITEQIWTDDSNSFFIRRVAFNQQTNAYEIAYTLPNGNTYIPTTGLKPASTGSGGSGGSGIDYEVLTERYIVTNSGTGYSIGDRLTRTIIYDVSTIPATLKSSFWYNLNTSAIITPTISDLELDVGERLYIGTNPASDANPVPIKAGTGVTLPVSISGFIGLTDNQLRANPLFVNQSGTWNVGITGTPSVSVTNTILDTNIKQFNGSPFGATNPVPVRLSDGTSFLSTLATTQSGTWTMNQGGVWNVGITGTPNVNISNTPSVTISGNAGVNITQFAGTTLAAANPIPIRLSNGTSFLSDLPVSQSGTWNVGIAGSLPTGTNTIGSVTQNGIWTVGISGIPNINITNTPSVTVSGNVGTNLTQLGGTTLGANNPLPFRLSDGTNFLGNLPVSQNGVWNINNISGTISLPSGAATSAKQDTINTSIANVNSKLPTPFALTNSNAIPVAIVDATGTQLTSFGGGGGGGTANTEYQEGITVAAPYGQIALFKDTSNVLKAVSSSTPLPISGSIVLATGSNVIGSISNTSFASTQSGNWSVRLQDGVGLGIESNITNPTGTERGLIVRNIPSGTQTISGTITANIGTTNGLATESSLSALNNKIPSNLTVTSTRLLVDGSGVTQPVSLSGTIGTNITQIGGSSPGAANTLPVRLSDGTAFLSNLPVSQSGTWNINHISGTVSLPTGAATSALQTTGNSSLSSIDSKTPALGQALAAGSIPVVLPSAQLTTLTPRTSVSLDAGTNIIGYVRQDGPWSTSISSALPTGGNTIGNVGITGVSAFNLTQVGGGAVGAGNPVPFRLSDGTSFLTTLPVSQSGNWLITGTYNSTPPSLTNGQIASLQMTTGGRLNVDSSQNGTWNINNISGTVSLPIGAATEATLSTLNGKVPALGQAVAASSVPVVLPTSQITTLTPPTSVGLNTGSNTIGSVNQSGIWSVRNQDGSGNAIASSTTTPTGTEQALIVRNIPSSIQSIRQSTDGIQNGTITLTPKFATITASTNGANTLVAAVTSRKIRVLGLILVSAGAVTVKFQTGTSTDITGSMPLVASSGFTLPFNPIGWFETTSGALLNLNLNAAVAVGGCLQYIEV